MGVRGAQLTWVTANTTVTVGQKEMLVYGTKSGPYAVWNGIFQAAGSSSQTVPANSYYGIVQNLPTVQYFGSYEQDEIADFMTHFHNTSGNTWVAMLMIQGDHMDSTVFTHWFN